AGVAAAGVAVVGLGVAGLGGAGFTFAGLAVVGLPPPGLTPPGLTVADPAPTGVTMTGVTATGRGPRLPRGAVRLPAASSGRFGAACADVQRVLPVRSPAGKRPVRTGVWWSRLSRGGA